MKRDRHSSGRSRRDFGPPLSLAARDSRVVRRFLDELHGNIPTPIFVARLQPAYGLELGSIIQRGQPDRGQVRVVRDSRLLLACLRTKGVSCMATWDVSG